jgi:hypothetical protein
VAGNGLNAVYDLRTGIGVIIYRNGLEPVVKKVNHGVAADVAGTTGYQYFGFAGHVLSVKSAKKKRNTEASHAQQGLMKLELALNFARVSFVTIRNFSFSKRVHLNTFFHRRNS